ncbi:hypothetical protein U0070_024573 [Myodes glareolus]|uniref:Voltage-dependent anion-selective channel protein 3 n=1 Tax=Myodes glareolus TaxID=447135 RepID=A0AAW0IDC2_MYOGA
MKFETSKSRVAQNSFAVGYKMGEIQLHTNVNGRVGFGGSVNQKVNKKVGIAVLLTWTTGNGNTRFRTAAEYQVDPMQAF